jgi:hypothetical protein
MGRCGEKSMDRELEELLARARHLKLSNAELEEPRIAIAAANGTLSDDRITLDTMKATRTIMIADAKPKATSE